MALQITRNVAWAVALVAGSVSVGAAQPRMNRGPNPDAPKLMVAACHAPDSVLANQCADKIRTQIEGDVSQRALTVIVKDDIVKTLQSSGYDPNVALNPGDAIALAKSIRADIYVDAWIEKAGPGYRITSGVVLARDANMLQPLGTVENAKIDGAVEGVSKSFRDVFDKTFDRQKSCFSQAREHKNAEAAKSVADGVKDFPKTTWLRYCNFGLLKDTKAPDAQIVQVLEEIRNIDPKSKAALQELSTRYTDPTKRLDVLKSLLAADPTNIKLTSQILYDMGALGKLDEAYPIATKAVADNPGEITLIQPYYLILGGLKKYKDAINVGKQMVTMDTSLADTAYFQKQIAFAFSDSNFTAGGEIADQAGVKFPKMQYSGNNVNAVAAALWKRVPNTEKAAAATQRWSKADPTAVGARVEQAKALLAENPPKFDQVIAIVKDMIAAKQDKDVIAGLAVQTGNVMRTASTADSMKAHGADAAAIRAATFRTYEVTAWADTLATGVQSVAAQGKFIMGVSAMSVGVLYLQDAGELGKKLSDDVKAIQPPNAAKQNAAVAAAEPAICANVAKSNDFITIASAAVPAGGRFNPQLAQQVMGSIMQLNGNVEQYIKAYHCKK